MSRAAKAPRGASAEPVQRLSAIRPLPCLRISRRDAIGVVMGSSQVPLEADFFLSSVKMRTPSRAPIVSMRDQARLVLAGKLRLNPARRDFARRTCLPNASRPMPTSFRQIIDKAVQDKRILVVPGAHDALSA